MAAKGGAGASKRRRLTQVHDADSSSDAGTRKPGARVEDSDGLALR
jgi:hypothetical protein